ncbi:YceD family protein [Parasediminibacterium sp. JCM 36343]|uniref:YceD family protein n=1 Tax=Parasediminibacterium sp. JCM 36343 TaxID=3374279 RepID=UPI0039782693
MSNRREFEIAFVGLRPGVHDFEYKIDNKFFAAYGEQDFIDCEAIVKLQLDKKNGFLQLKFDIDGNAAVVCDRCSNPLDKQLWEEFNIIVKMVDDPDTMNQQEEDPDIYYISRSESHLKIADWIYEFVSLSIPLQKMCSDEEIGGGQCNKEVLAKLKQMEEEVNKLANPLWKGLEKFKDL